MKAERKIRKSLKKSTGKSKNTRHGGWKRVKIAGKILSNDDGGGTGTGTGLEGLIGLEVMETYNPKIITQEKRKRGADADDNEKYPGFDPDKFKDKNEKRKKHKKSKVKETREKTFPGQFVLLKPDLNSINEEVEETAHSQNIEPTTSDDLVAWQHFGISDVILKAIGDLKFHEPTRIQMLTLPAAIMGKKDILGAAETGSGKTLAFGIPILNSILELKSKGLGTLRTIKQMETVATVVPMKKNVVSDRKRKQIERDNLTPPPEELAYYPEPFLANSVDTVGRDKPLYALILTPTRELAVQVKDHIIAVAKYTGIKVAVIFGGLAAVKQERVLSKCPEIVVATPGRLWELIREGNAHLNKIDDIRFLVIDETDRMIEKGHFDELKLILDRINANPEKKLHRQNFVFSATLTFVHELPTYLKNKLSGKRRPVHKETANQKIEQLISHLGISQPKVVDITSTMGTAQTLTECRITCQLDQKDLYLYYFLKQHPGRTIVFCNSIDCVRRLTQLFSLLECQPRALHAHMNQKQRLKNLEKFTSSNTALLLATDVAARGLDIPNVQHVIHYQVPRTSENYIHRSGRTARANNDGIAVLIMEPGESKDYVKLCRTLGRTENLPLFPISDRYLKAVKDRVELAKEVDILELRNRRSQNDIGWLKKCSEDMDIIVDDLSDSNDSLDDETDERSKENRLLKQKRLRLKKLLSEPIFPKGFSYKYPTTIMGTFPSEMSHLNDNKENKAVKVMKAAILENAISKKRKNHV